MKQKTSQEMRPLVAAYSRYEGSKKAFCAEYGIAVHLLDYWHRKLSVDTAPSDAFIKLEVGTPPVSGQYIELYYPNGVEVKVPLDTPAAILQHLLTIAC